MVDRIGVARERLAHWPLFRGAAAHLPDPAQQTQKTAGISTRCREWVRGSAQVGHRQAGRQTGTSEDRHYSSEVEERPASPRAAAIPCPIGPEERHAPRDLPGPTRT